ncbi:MAG TPA: GMC family oxidoreductase N-terminal domain-containing protein [Solirubrobacteraceae bacterium]|nr:GMC family oxidoreductase N-terminal domain-containing protein [Solirubrobacteraceae bacterium]
MSDKAYDYVIVGAGSAGCVVAGRLSEDPDVSVLVLEAGGPDVDPWIRFPYVWPGMLKSALDWDLLSEKEPGLDGRRIYLPRGKMVGGCGSINAMIYIRGNRADFDEWAEIAGDDSWSYERILPYFRRSEDYEGGEDMFHGVGGPLAVSFSRSMNPLVDVMLEAAVNAGHERNPDLNGARQEGVGRWPLTQRDGRRFSPADAFLHPALKARSNVELVTSAMTSRILFEGERAVGVEYVKDGRAIEVRAEREVVVSAGAFQSPVLLMLSGIGPADHLRAMGIDVRADLPVGENYQDHLMFVLNYVTDGDDALFDKLTPENLELYERGEGPLTSNYPEAGGFFRTRAGLRGPDVEFHFSPSMLYDEGLTVPEAPGVAFGPALVQPSSRGFVRLRTPLPHSKPVIQLNSLTTEDDRQSAIAGVRLALEVAAQSPLKERIVRPFSIPESDSDEDILAWVRATSMTVFHPTSTCSMGSVVDAQLRVRGVEGLRVIDASVMPTITRANTHAATIMIGEKGADLLKGVTSATTTQRSAAA